MLRPVLMTMLAVVLPILLAGCKTTGSAGTESVCAQWRSVSWSSKDTLPTIDEVKGNNARRRAWCA